MMHKNFYASGFIYHLPSERILLQQLDSSIPWALFGTVHEEKEDPKIRFSEVISDILGIRHIDIYPVYSYYHEQSNTNQSILYGELETLRDFPKKNGTTFQWFSFKDVIKLSLSTQTKHDLVVSKRVIDATARKSRGEFTSTK